MQQVSGWEQPSLEEVGKDARRRAIDALPPGAGRECGRCGIWKLASAFFVSWRRGQPYLPPTCKECWPRAGARTEPPAPRQCASCHKMFTPKRHDYARLCPETCSRGAKVRPKVEKPPVVDGKKLCVGCGEWKPVETGFFARPSKRPGPDAGVYVSAKCRECQYEERREKFRAQGVASKRKVEDGLKRCNGCGEAKPVGANFDVRGITRMGEPRYSSRCHPCDKEYARERSLRHDRRKRGVPLDLPKQPPRKQPAPEGATRVSVRDGYVREKRTGHHRAVQGWVLQHILVAEEKYGFPITRDLTVDHINDQRSDNRPENLELRVGNHGYHGKLVPTLLARQKERGIAVGELLNHPGYRAELFAEMSRRGFAVLVPFNSMTQAAA